MANENTKNNETLKGLLKKWNKPIILFVGSGISKRYLKKAYTWEELLKEMCQKYLNENDYYVLKNYHDKDLVKIASSIEKMIYDKILLINNGHFTKTILSDDWRKLLEYWEKVLKRGENASKDNLFKWCINKILNERNNKSRKDDVEDEVLEFKKLNIFVHSIITTNYDFLLKEIFENFSEVTNDNILEIKKVYLNIYKIHGTISESDNEKIEIKKDFANYNTIIISESDYANFESNLIVKSHLLYLFSNFPIVFLGYSLKDKNILNLLEDFFKDLNNSTLAKVSENFLFVEYNKNKTSESILEDWSINFGNLREAKIKKIVLNNKSFKDFYIELYKNLQENGKLTDYYKDALDNVDSDVLTAKKNFLKYSQFLKLEGSGKSFKDIWNIKKSFVKKTRLQSQDYFPIFIFLQNGFSRKDLIKNSTRKTEIDLVKNQKDKIKKLLCEHKEKKNSIISQVFKLLKEDINEKDKIINEIKESIEKFLPNDLNNDIEIDTKCKKLFILYDFLRFGKNSDVNEIKKYLKDF
nr:SIR2 family protein [Mycoplasmopsis canis]WQQ12572.1 SIR2 family protein [Mycoplasmopsis canis]